MKSGTTARRAFLRGGLVLLGAAGLSKRSFAAKAGSRSPRPPADGSGEGELLYNGIRLPAVWPPRTQLRESREPMRVPYLECPPEIIPIDLGRQLFVDDFLIAQTTLARRFHRARKHAGNPVLRPETPLEMGNGQPVACPKSGGVWWDPAARRFKMWYEAGWLGTMAYATSADGLRWERPALDVQPGTNRLLPNLRPDSTTVFLDHDATEPAQRYKMFLRRPGGDLQPGQCLVSADGVHWSEPVPTGDLGDRSTMFYNPFRRKWVFSIRSGGRLGSKARGRARYYREHADYLQGAKWTDDDLAFWTGADALDPADPAIGDAAQLYNLDAVAYESLLLGVHEIHLGPNNRVCEKGGFPKITELMLGYSRDGFHWHRPDRAAFIAAARRPGVWDRGYVQSVGGVCAVVGDQLWFYYIGFRGDESRLTPGISANGMYAHGATGLAVLRRDGFASMAAGPEGGTLTTRPLVFQGDHLFVNVCCPRGELRVEVLDRDGRPIAPLSAQQCAPIAVDRTLHEVTWRTAGGLASLAGRPVRLRFHLRDGDLYAFWVTPDASGASRGFVAAGGPGFTGARDTVGSAAGRGAVQL